MRVVVGKDSATVVETWNILLLGGLILIVSPVLKGRIERLSLPINLNGAAREGPSPPSWQGRGGGGANTEPSVGSIYVAGLESGASKRVG